MATVLPAMTSPRSAASTWRVRSFSACSMRALKDCSTVRPASSSEAKPRVSWVSSVPESDTGRNLAPPAGSLAAMTSTRCGVSPWSRSSARAWRALSASSTPLWSLPSTV